MPIKDVLHCFRFFQKKEANEEIYFRAVVAVNVVPYSR